jgi:SAM-dependent methyltransferase
MLFRCNFCGQQSDLESTHLLNPELPSCSGCASNIRFRWLVHRLSRELFGQSFQLADFPPATTLKGLGLSDPEILSEGLAKSFTYRNTFYDRDPRFDIRRDISPIGELDFLIASEVFEHIEPPVWPAFQNAARLLKPGGVFLLTVPWVWEGAAEDRLPDFYDWKLAREEGRWLIVNRRRTGEIQRFYDPVFDGLPGPCLGNTREHFPELFDWTLVEQNSQWTLINRRPDGSTQRFENLVFHGGPGLALEMRLFTRADIARQLTAAGFRHVEFDDTEVPEYGIAFPYPWSHPIVVRR